MGLVTRSAWSGLFFTLVLPWTPSAVADVVIGEPIHFGNGGTDAESLAVTPDGRLVAATAPELVDPDADDEVFRSGLSKLLHAPSRPGEPVLGIGMVELGGGEITDVVLHPLGSWAVVNVRSDDANEVDELRVIRGSSVVQRVPLSDSADGLALSPDGQLLAVAVEKGARIELYSTSGRAGVLSLLAAVGEEALLAWFTGAEAARIAEEDIEPESAKFSPDGSMLLVSLQEQSSIAVIDVTVVVALDGTGASPEAIGDAALASVVHLPFGFENNRGEIVGVEPDGLGVSPDGSFAIVANEASNRARHLQGISVIDLRGGPWGIPAPTTYCIFDIDPTLLDGAVLDDGTPLGECPVAGEGGEFPDEELHDALPRLDPNNTIVVSRGGSTIAVLCIERPPHDEDRGSLLFLDVGSVLDGVVPSVLRRVPVGLGDGEPRPEGLQSSNGGRYVWVALQRDDGTCARIEIED